MNYIVIRVHKEGSSLSGRAAGLLADYARRRRGKRPWPRTTVDAFPGRGGTLLLARPAPPPALRIADYALPLLLEYARRRTT